VMDHYNIEARSLIHFFLYFSRIAAVMASPLFSGPANLPLISRLMIIIGITYLFASAFEVNVPAVHDLGGLTFLIGIEVVNGIFLLFGIYVMIYALELAGRLIDYQGGYSAASVFNPASKEQSSIFGTLLLYLFIYSFYAFDIHHEVFWALKQTFVIFPVGESILGDNVATILSHLGRLTVLGVLISAPICISLFLIDVVAGMIAKSMPQINVYFLLLPVKLFVCLLAVFLCLENSMLLFGRLNTALLDFIAIK